MSFAVKIVIICIAELLYVFLLYPLLLRVLATFFKKPVKTVKGFRPTVDVVVAAYNEERLIAGAVRSVYNDGYPEELLKVWVGNDGSTDKTAEVLSALKGEFPSLTVLNFPRTGKNGVLNSLFKKLSGEITIFIDADTRIIPGTIGATVEAFSDKEVGAVIGEITFDRKDENSSTHGESVYKIFEKQMKVRESAIHSIVTSHGPFYAVRGKFVEPIPNNKVCDDFIPLLKVALQGKRILYQPEAHVYEVREKDIQYEFTRIIRFTAGGLASIWETKKLLLPGAGHGWFTFFLWSHKILRWLSPFFIIALFVASAAGSFKNHVILLLFIAQSIIFIMAFLGWIGEKKSGGIMFFKLSYFFFVMNVSMMIGVIRFFKNSSTALWEPSNR